MIASRAVSFVFVAASVALAACSSEASSSAAAPIASIDQACDHGARAICQKYYDCAPFLIAVVYGDVATCVERARITCKPSLTATGTSASSDRVDRCASELKSASCADFLGRTPPESCRTESGALGDGASCGTSDQCKGRLCRRPERASCGACSTLAAVGGACESDGDCEYGLGCADAVCASLGNVGAPCSKAAPCSGDLACTKGACAKPLLAGMACEPAAGENPCDARAGLYCNAKSRLCTTIGTSPAGGPCGVVGDAHSVCSGGATCSATGLSGTCQAAAADGAACDETNGPNCLPPARCSGGVCKITDPANCN